MSISGRPESSEPIEMPELSVTVIAGTWHERITGGLIAGAQRVLEAAGAGHSLIRVPGSFELPVVAQSILAGETDAVVALGVIIRGGTPHFEYVAAATTQGLLRVALDTGKPVGFGVLTLDDEQQGLERAGFENSREDKGAEAAEAVLRTARILRSLNTQRDL